MLGKEEALKYIEDKPDAKFVIRTEDEDKSFLENFKQSEVKRVLSEEASKLHSRYNDDIFELYGFKPAEGEKFYEVNKKLHRENLDKIKDYEARIEKLSKGSGTQNDSKIRELEGLIETIRKEKDEQIVKERQEKVTYQTRSELEKALAVLPQEPSIPEAARQALVESTLSRWLPKAEWQENKLVFKDEKGEVVRNKQTYEPKTAAEILGEELNPILKKDRKLPGIDIKKDVEAAKIVTVLPAHVTTKAEMSKHLASLGLKRHEKEYIEAYALAKDLPSGL
jgi:hypothetical protein